EDILDAKRGHFPKNQLGFLVAWKGYGPEHNSWVTEEDAYLNISAYWKRNPDKNPNKKKASQTPSKRTSTSARKAVANDASDAGRSASVVKQRGRKSVSEKSAAKDDDEPPAKKARKISEKETAAARASASEEPMQGDEEEVGDMAEYMQLPNWDQLVKQIDAVERVDDTLYVYFTLYVLRSLPAFVFKREIQPNSQTHAGRLEDLRERVGESGGMSVSDQALSRVWLCLDRKNTP
ncbi:hypothetical protein DFH06DRAFT_990163, partial [Mycena polygramma]